jgi:hypothetical protein
MKRLEIIANSSVEDSIFEAFKWRGVAQMYTKIPIVHGVGHSGPRRGDHVWPEENFLLIIYCEPEEAKNIREAVYEVKAKYQVEGIKLFEIGE